MTTYNIPFRAPLGPLGYRSTDGRTLSITGLYDVRSPAPIFLHGLGGVMHDPFGVVVGMITAVDPQDGWLWALGLMEDVNHVLALNDRRLVLLADFEIYEERASIDGLDILDCKVVAARLATLEHWAWGEYLW